MRIIHFGHSCVLLETGSARLLIDPGTFSTGFEMAREVDAILVTHQHPDHLDEERLPILLAANPGAVVVVDPGSAPIAARLGIEARVVAPGDRLELAGAAVEVVGGEHAVIHRDVPVVANNGYLVDGGAFYHPGDSLVVPPQPVDVLGAPAGAPWLKIAEAVGFVRAVAPRVAVPIHEGTVNRVELHYGWLDRLSPAATTVTVLPQGELADV